MGQSWKYIAGALITVLAVIGGVALYRSGAQPEDDLTAAPEVATEPLMIADAAPLPEPVTNAASPDELAGRIDALVARLADREAALAAATASLAERDASLDTLTTTLAAREAEIQTLRDELAMLRERYAFDLELEAIKGGGGDPRLAPILSRATAPAEPAAEPALMALTRIHFESGSSALTPGGQVHVAAAAVMLAEMPVGRVRLLGYADRVGRPERNRALATARARAVADFLVRSGVSVDLLDVAGMGEDDLPVATADGVAEPLNRSVAILAVPRPTT
jgi:outer membrane protein OmpA-like peptidoglycan-associated protein